MPFNVGQLRDQIELYAGLAGVTKDKLNPELVRTVINQKMREFVSKTSIVSKKATIESVADQQEYELPSDCVHISKVNYDSSVAVKISFNMVDEIAGNT